jgi:hypothetical protein
LASLYADENVPLELVETLRRLGHDVLTAQEAGQANQAIADERVLDFAVERKRAVLTFNRWQFIRMHTVRPRHWGIIVCTVDLDIERQAARIHEAIRKVDRLEGVLLRVNLPG